MQKYAPSTTGGSGPRTGALGQIFRSRSHLARHRRSSHRAGELLNRLPRSFALAPGSKSEVADGLIEFVRTKGGVLHPALSLQTDEVMGAPRGLVATAPIPADAILFQLPISLRVTADSARQVLETMVCAKQGLETLDCETNIEELDDVHVLGLWLAVERAKGSESAWSQYLDALPARAYCGWAKSEGDLAADWSSSLYKLGMDLEWWTYFLGQARQEIELGVSRLVKDYGQMLTPPGAATLTVADAMWGVGLAMSRKFEVEGQVFLEPLSDALNLRTPDDPNCVKWTYARSSMGKGAEAGAVKSAGGGDGSIVVSRAMFKAGAKGITSAGQEIFNSHGFVDMTVQGRLTPLAAYLLHGHVPADMLEVVRMRATHTALLPFSSGSVPEVEEEDGMEEQGGASTKMELDKEEYASPADVPPTQLYDYLTQQYQKDVIEVLDIVFMALIQREQQGGARAYSETPKEVQSLLNLLREVPYPKGPSKLPELIGRLDATVIEVIDMAEGM